MEAVTHNVHPALHIALEVGGTLLAKELQEPQPLELDVARPCLKARHQRVFDVLARPSVEGQLRNQTGEEFELQGENVSAGVSVCLCACVRACVRACVHERERAG